MPGGGHEPPARVEYVDAKLGRGFPRQAVPSRFLETTRLLELVVDGGGHAVRGFAEESHFLRTEGPRREPQ